MNKNTPMKSRHKKLSKKLGRRGMSHSIGSSVSVRRSGKKSYPNYFINRQWRKLDPNIRKIRDGKIVSVWVEEKDETRDLR